MVVFGTIINAIILSGQKCSEGFWKNKILGNEKNDRRKQKELFQKGWRIVIVWECAITGKNRIPLNELVVLIGHWLESNKSNIEIEI